MLGDVQNIIEGYIRFKTQPEAERDVPFQQTPDQLEVEQLEDRIAKFKDRLYANTNQEPDGQN